MTFAPPGDMKHRDGSSRYAYTTFLLFNLSRKYVSSALLLAYALRKQQTQADLICMVTPEVTPDIRAALKIAYDYVVEVDPVYIPHKRRHQRPDRPFLFTRLQALRLGPDGDLGFNYDKVVILDADILPLRHYDHMFSLDTPAGIINEKKEHFMDYDEQGRYIIPPSVEECGKWKWHRIYEPICPHATRIPQEITDRVKCDLTNLGIIGALFVMETSMAEFEDILDDVRRPGVRELVSDKFDLPDMQYLTMRYSGEWTNIDLRFCGLSGYPSMDVLFGTHYAGNIKPWSYNHKGLKRYSRYEDFQYWYREFIEMMTEGLPRLQRFQRLVRELEQAHQLEMKGVLM